MTDSITLHLPMPPSLNSSTPTIMVVDKETRAVYPRRIKSKDAKAWVKEAGWELNLQNPPQFTAPVEIAIRLQRDGTKRRNDGDNRTKALLDLLKAHRVIKDDSADFVIKTSVEWVSPGAGPACAVTISEA